MLKALNVVGCLLIASASLASCSSENSEAASHLLGSSEGTAEGEKDLHFTGSDTSGTKGGETYEEYDTRRDRLEGSYGYSSDYGCTEDCSGHDAGYQWAEDHGISDESECGGKSWSFQEGCAAYAQEQERLADEEYEEME